MPVSIQLRFDLLGHSGGFIKVSEKQKRPTLVANYRKAGIIAKPVAQQALPRWVAVAFRRFKSL